MLNHLMFQGHFSSPQRRHRTHRRGLG